jgi:hypothetical protein
VDLQALIQHFDRARVQTAGARAIEILTRAAFDDHNVDPRQCQLAGQHHPGRAATGDHHRVLGHASVSARLGRLRQAPTLAVNCCWRRGFTLDDAGELIGL